MKLILTACPVIPFVTEEIYLNLRTEGMPESIHLCDFPVYDESKRDHSLERKMEITRQAVSMGRAIRSMYSLKIRQPLKAIHLVTLNTEEKKILREMTDIIREELNVKDVIFRENEEDLVEYQAKANYKLLGKQLGKDMKEAAKKIEALSMKEIQSLMEGATLEIDLDGRTIDLNREGIVVQRLEKENLKVLNEGSLTVALDPEITEELKREGMIRDLVRSVQSLRKDSGFEVTDRIRLYLHGPDEIKTAVESFEDYLVSETLAVSWDWSSREGSVPIECGDGTCSVHLEKVST
jgi:isoleucyl-tRNA synthetase